MLEEIAFTKDGLRAWLHEAPWAETYGLDAAKIDQMVDYADLLVETNKHMNLTGITDIQGIAERHILDSLTALPALDKVIEHNFGKTSAHPVRVADVGTGAGLPGVILKIMRPEIELYLIDSLAKRIRFLERVSEALGFQDVHHLHLRAEEAGRSVKLREQMDFVTARAVAELRVLAEYCLPLAKKGGLFLAMKANTGSEVQDAKRAISVLGGRLEGEEQFLLPGTDMNRLLVHISKVKATPQTYPREAGKLQKKPL